MMRYVMRVLVFAVVGVALSGCVTSGGPTPFEIGDEAPPPAGCVEGRARGVDC